MTHHSCLINDYLITLINTDSGIIFNLYHFLTMKEYSAFIRDISEIIPKNSIMLFFQKCLDTNVENYSISFNIMDDDDKNMKIEIKTILDSYITFTKDYLIPITTNHENISTKINLFKLNNLMKDSIIRNNEIILDVENVDVEKDDVEKDDVEKEDVEKEDAEKDDMKKEDAENIGVMINTINSILGFNEPDILYRTSNKKVNPIVQEEYCAAPNIF